MINDGTEPLLIYQSPEGNVAVGKD